MESKRTLTIATLLALAALLTLGVFRGTRMVHAQEQPPALVVGRISFGMIGIARGQTARLNVTNPDETRPVVINWKLLDSDSEVLRRRDGQPIERTMTLAAGHSAFLQVNADNLLGRDEVRLNLRAVVSFHPPPEPERGELPPGPPDNNPFPPGPPDNNPSCMPSVEIINNISGITAFTQSAPPAVQRVGSSRQ
jgi:hypothetical protein